MKSPIFRHPWQHIKRMAFHVRQLLFQSIGYVQSDSYNEIVGSSIG